jgi:hypothetical protein
MRGLKREATVFGNIGTIVSFRIGQNDVESLSRYFQPQFDGDDLLRVPNANTIVRTLINGVPTQPFSMATLPPLGNPNQGLADALKQLSSAKYGKPRAVVEKEIFERLATKAPEPKPFSNPFAANQPAATAPVAAAAPPSAGPARQGSFLDEWLAKQKTMPSTPHASAPAPAPTSTPAAQTPVSNEPVPNTPAPPAPVSPATQTPPQPIATQAQIPTTEPPESFEAGNVSSVQLDQQEVKDIAAELKRNLKTEVQKTDVPAPAPQATPAPGLVADQEGEIFIDSDGNIHQPTSDTED